MYLFYLFIVYHNDIALKLDDALFFRKMKKNKGDI